MLRLPLCCSILAGAVFVHAANEGLPASESLAGSAPLASFSAAGETSMQAAPGDLSRRAQTSAAPQSVTVNATGTMPLSLKRAVEIALTPEGNTRAALALETIAQANQRVREARAAFLPSIDGSVRDSRQVNNLQAFGFGFSFLVPGLSGFSIPTIVGPFTIFDTRGTIQQSALNFSDIRKYQASKVNAAAAAADNDATRNSVRDEVARAYLAALRADANRDTARANVELAQALRDLAVRQK